MKKVRITAVRKASYPDLMEKYENPIQHACDVAEGQIWIANGWQKPDYYFVLYELLPYIDRKLDAIYDTQNPLSFGRKAMMNTASAGYFSSDRTVLDYAKDIWDLKPFPHQNNLKLF